MSESNDVIKELNSFLRGQYMGIHAYESYISRINDPHLKGKLQQIQQDHKRHAAQIADRIQDLGGTAVDDEGAVNSLKQSMSKMTIPDDDKGIIKNALYGENHYGIEMAEELVRGDLDEGSLDIVKDILDEDRRHVDIFRRMLQ